MANDVKIILSADDKTGAAITSVRAGLQSMRPHIEAASLAMLGFGTVAGAAAAALAAFSVSVKAIDSFNDLADATGASVENISALDRVARETGGNFDTVSTSLIKFNAALKNTDGDNSGAAAALKAIGLSAKELKAIDPAEALLQTAVALAGFADDGNKARLTQELFGKSLAEVAPLLKDLAEKGALVKSTTTEQAAAAETFNKQLFKLKANSEDAARAMTSSLVPALNEVLEAFNAKGFKASVDQFGETVFGWTSNAKRKEIANITEDLGTLEFQLKRATGYGEQGQISQQIDAKVARLSALKGELIKSSYDLAGGGLHSTGFTPENKPSVGFTTPDKDKTAKAVDLTKQQESAVQGLSEKLAGLTDNTGEYDKVLQRLTTGTWKGFDATTKSALQSLARLVDETQVATNQVKLSDAASAEQRDKARKAQVEYTQAAVEGMLAVSDYADAIAMQNAQYALEIDLMGKSESSRRLALADYQIELDLKEQLLAIDKNIGLTEEQRTAERERARAAAGTAKTGVAGLIGAQDARLQDPTAGLMDGLAEYQKTVADVAVSTKAMMVNAFQGMEDAMVSFVKTGKLDFSSLADSIISDLVRIAIQQSITGPLAGAMAGMFSLNADGGVYSSASLSAYSGQVVSSPTMFAFAKGAGLMGEAGPEAIMPLTRDSSGKLGVRSVGPGGGGSLVVNIIESSDKAGKVESRTDGGVDMLDIFVERVKSAIANDISKGSGAVPNALSQTYSLNRAAGAY